MPTEKTYKKEYTNSWAFIIGIDDYKKASPLSYAKNDAEGIADILEKKFKFQKENISLLLNENATQKNIRDSFNKFTKKDMVQPDDRLLVFFAGHGHTVEGKRGEVGFLVPTDGDPNEISTLVRWNELTMGGDLIPAKHIFYIMDACYGGLAFLRAPSFGSMRFLGDMLTRYTRQALTAGKADETVSDGNGVKPGHSIFTSHLLEGLEGNAATKDGIITASGIMAYVYDRVGRDQYSNQTPHFGYVDGDGDFIFDTSLLDEKQKIHEEKIRKEKTEGETGDDDILINTSPQITEINNTETSVAKSMKELLSDPSKKIKLDDFVTAYVREFLDATDLRHFPVQNLSAQKENFIDRLNQYKELSKNLQQIVILLAKWGNKEQLRLLETIFKRLAEADKGSSGTILWLRFNWFPILILMYSAGISGLASKNYEVLKIILETSIKFDLDPNKDTPIVTPVVMNLSEIHDNFKWIPGYERNYVPRSEYLFKELQPILEDMLFLGRSYEQLYDSFEVLFALVYAYDNERDWFPPGRFAWKDRSPIQGSPYNNIVEEAKKQKENWGVLKTGLFSGSIDEFLKVATACKGRLDKLSWF